MLCSTALKPHCLHCVQAAVQGIVIAKILDEVDNVGKDLQRYS